MNITSTIHINTGYENVSRSWKWKVFYFSALFTWGYCSSQFLYAVRAITYLIHWPIDLSNRDSNVTSIQFSVFFIFCVTTVTLTVLVTEILLTCFCLATKPVSNVLDKCTFEGTIKGGTTHNKVVIHSPKFNAAKPNPSNVDQSSSCWRF